MVDRMEQLAEQRTASAHGRTLLAEERTYSAWIRTGLASIATGLVIVKLIGEAQPRWLVLALGVVFVVAGATMFVLAFWTYRAALRNHPLTPTRAMSLRVIGGLSLALTAGAVLALVLVFL